MARPVSWLPRLHALVRSVSESVRSHYASEDIERLFELQPRSAQMLMNLLPTVRVGKSLLVEREVLSGFLGRLADAEDPTTELAALRIKGKPPVVRRKLRDLVRKDVDLDRSGMPPNVELTPGRLTVRFATVEELAAALLSMATLLQEDLEDIARRYEHVPEKDPSLSAGDELERQDADYFREWTGN